MRPAATRRQREAKLPTGRTALAQHEPDHHESQRPSEHFAELQHENQHSDLVALGRGRRAKRCHARRWLSIIASGGTAAAISRCQS